MIQERKAVVPQATIWKTLESPHYENPPRPVLSPVAWGAMTDLALGQIGQICYQKTEE